MEGYLIDATCGSAERVGRIRRYDISVSEDGKELGELYGWVASHEDAAHQVAREGGNDSLSNHFRADSSEHRDRDRSNPAWPVDWVRSR